MSCTLNYALKCGFIAIIATSFVLGCKPRELSEVFPVVELKEISFNPETGAMTMRGEVISPGDYDIIEVGFYSSTQADFASNWVLHKSSLNGNEFTTTFYSRGYPWNNGFLLEDGIEIYGKAYAANELGFGLSEIKKSDPCYIPDVDTPCDLAINKIEYGTNLGTLDIENYYYYSESGYTNEMSNAENLNNFTARFNRTVTKGIYTTTEVPDNGNPQEVYIEFIGKKIAAGNLLYVEYWGTDSLDISLCEGMLLPDNLPAVFRFRTKKW